MKKLIIIAAIVAPAAQAQTFVEELAAVEAVAPWTATGGWIMRLAPPSPSPGRCAGFVIHAPLATDTDKAAWVTAMVARYAGEPLLRVVYSRDEDGICSLVGLAG